MGFPMIPKWCSGVIPFRNYKTMKTTNVTVVEIHVLFEETGFDKKTPLTHWKKMHIVCWARSASRRSVTSVFKQRPWHWNCLGYVFYYHLDVLYEYLHVFSNYKTLESPYEVTINEHVLHIQRSYMDTFAGTATAGLLYTVWICVLCMWNTHVQTGCLACVPVPSIHVYKHTTQSSYGPSVLH